MDEQIPESERYLWDGNGPADPLVKRLEDALRPARAELEPSAVVGRIGARRAGRWARHLAIAAALAVIGAGAWYYATGPHGTPSPRPGPSMPQGPAGWTLLAMAGDAKAEPVSSGKSLMSGSQRFETGPGGSIEARGKSGETVTIRENSGGRLVTAEDGTRHVTLDSGGAFVVASKAGGSGELAIAGVQLPGSKELGRESYTVTPSAEAAVMVSMDSSGKTPGAGQIMVNSGEVTVRGNKGRIVARLAGAMTARVDPARGIGTPAPAGKDSALAEVLAKFDEGDPKDLKSRWYTLHKAMEAADARTLWNLLLRVREEERGGVLKRLEESVMKAGGSAPKVDPEAVVRLDDRAMEEWWRAAVAASGK